MIVSGRSFKERNEGFRVAAVSSGRVSVVVVQDPQEAELVVAIGFNGEGSLGESHLYAANDFLADIIVRGIRSLEADRAVITATDPVIVCLDQNNDRLLELTSREPVSDDLWLGNGDLLDSFPGHGAG